MTFFKKVMFLMLVVTLFSIATFAQNQANVLCDKKTATWCTYCPGAAAIFEDLRTQYGSRVPMIAWHPTSDPFGTAFTNFWTGAISTGGYPTMCADHIYEIVGASDDFKTQVATRLGVSRALLMTVTAGTTGGVITIQNSGSTSISGNLMAVIVERHIRYNWLGETELDFVARLNCYTNDKGKAVTIAAGQTITENVSYNLSSIPYPTGALPAEGGAKFELVAYVMHPTTYDCYQAAYAPAIDCPTPTASFTYSSLGNYKIKFTDTSIAGSGATLVSWHWGFGESPYLGTSTLQHPEFIFPTHGSYPCCVDVTNSCGKSAGICMPVDVPPAAIKDDIIGVFPSVGGLWKMENTGTSFAWTRLSLQEPDMIRMGDVNGNGIDDLGCLYKATQKFWIRYDNGTWADVPASAKDMICFDLGDINKDGYADIVGSWTFGTWWKNTATGVWAKLSNMSPTYLAAGDFDGDGYCDIVGLYPTLASLWIYQYNGSKWTQISKQINLNDLRTGDFNDDGKAEVLGSWNIGTWTFNPITNVWVKHSNNKASVLCAGDINGLGKDDICGDWAPNVPGVWIKYMEDGSWKQASKQIPKDITSGRTK